MGKHRRKQIERLQVRQKSYDQLPSDMQRSRTRPGSMNPRKSQSVGKKR